MNRNPAAPKPIILFVGLILLFGPLFPRLNAQSTEGPSNHLTVGTGSLNFLVISDWGRDGINDRDHKTPGQLKVAHQFGATARQVNASFVVTCGDNFHGKGVSTPTDPLWAENFEHVYGDESLMIPWYITLGNHDYEGNVEAELEYAKVSKRWVQPARYYAFTRELPGAVGILFVVLDSSPLIEEYQHEKNDQHHVKGQDTTAQIHWCDSVLAASVARWKFVFFHHPAFSASSVHGSTLEIQRAFVPLFKKYHVDACFSGHDHDLQHSHPEGSTVEYFGVGGGSESRPTGHAVFTKYSNASLGFGVVSVSSSTTRFSFVNANGEQVYTYEIRK
ncbi:MAG TPA: metallophosphoesterase [Bacteroidota bacterium]|nr:metallophosphoesterase [Bacteroidota bacterium]